MTHDCFAVATPGLEPVVAAELAAIGVETGEVVAGGVSFRGGDADVFAANLHLRAASRVIVRVASFTARSFAELERRAKAVEWQSYATDGSPVAFRVTCRKSRLYHSGAVAERLARSLTARLPNARIAGAGANDESDGDDRPDGAATGDAPRAPARSQSATGAVPQLFIVRLEHDECTISADASGELLHRRGYRKAVAKAPIRETIAAGVLLALGYDGSVPLVDPMCGSGTIAIEGALIARRIAPGIGRTFACETWPAFDGAAASRARTGARAAQRDAAAAPIVASDRDEGAIAAALANAERAGVAADVTVEHRALSAIAPPAGPGLLVVNPPYGARVGDSGTLRNLYAQLGNVARAKLPGWRVALISADRSLERHTKLPLVERLRLSNGGIRVRLVAGDVPR